MYPVVDEYFLLYYSVDLLRKIYTMYVLDISYIGYPNIRYVHMCSSKDVHVLTHATTLQFLLL